jgi:hypothetical protein
MLSDNIQIMKRTKEMIPILSSVRVQRFDDSSFLGRQRIYEFVPFVSLPGEKDCLAGRDRKVSIVNERLAVAICQNAGQNIKAASNGVEIDASLDLECERERLFFRDDHHIIGNVSWQLSDSHMHIIAEPSIKLLLQEWEVDSAQSTEAWACCKSSRMA